MKIKTEFEIAYNVGKLKLGVKEKCTITNDMVAAMLKKMGKYNGNGKNLSTMIRNRKVTDSILAGICEVFDLDLGKMFKLKVK